MAGLVPKSFDNAYSGSRIALVILGVVAFMKTGMGTGAYVNPHFVASTPDSLPIDSYAPAAAQLILSLFQVWGLGQILLGLLSWLALIRYRSMEPLMLLILLLEQIGRKGVFWLHPVARKPDTPLALGLIPYADVINYGFMAALLLGFILSLRQERSSR